MTLCCTKLAIGAALANVHSSRLNDACCHYISHLQQRPCATHLPPAPFAAVSLNKLLWLHQAHANVDSLWQALPEDQLREIYQQAAAAGQAQQTPQQQQREQKADAWEGQQVDGAERLVVRSFARLVFLTNWAGLVSSSSSSSL